MNQFCESMFCFSALEAAVVGLIPSREPQVSALLADKLFAEKNIFSPSGAGDIRDSLQLLANTRA